MNRAEEENEFRRGWPILAASMICIGLGLNVLPVFSIGMFAPHLAREFGWGMGDIMGGYAVMTVVILGSVPLTTLIASRFGVRAVAIVSLILFSFSFMSFGLTNGSLLFYYATWALIALVGAGTLPPTWTSIVIRNFDVHKGLALGIAVMGTGVFGAMLKPITAGLIEAVGWRYAYVTIGLFPLIIATPIAFFLFYASRVGPTLAPSRNAKYGANQEEGISLAEALRGWRCWLLIIVFPLITVALAAPIMNIESVIRLGGIPEGEIVHMAAFIGISSIVGRVAGGFLLDRFWAPLVAFGAFSMAAIGCWILSHGSIGYLPSLVSIILLGFTIGLEIDVLGYMVARYFGAAYYSSIYGIIYGLVFLAAGVGPWIFGHIFDEFASYSIALTVSSLVITVGSLSFLSLGAYRYGTIETKAMAASATT